MNGSPKQIEWAQKIRSEYAALKPQHEIDAEAAEILNSVFSCEDASFWIFCQTQRKQGIRAIALSYHDRVGKLAKTGIDVGEILMANNVR